MEHEILLMVNAIGGRSAGQTLTNGRCVAISVIHVFTTVYHFIGWPSRSGAALSMHPDQLSVTVLDGSITTLTHSASTSSLITITLSARRCRFEPIYEKPILFVTRNSP